MKIWQNNRKLVGSEGKNQKLQVQNSEKLFLKLLLLIHHNFTNSCTLTWPFCQQAVRFHPEHGQSKYLQGSGKPRPSLLSNIWSSEAQNHPISSLGSYSQLPWSPQLMPQSSASHHLVDTNTGQSMSPAAADECSDTATQRSCVGKLHRGSKLLAVAHGGYRAHQKSASIVQETVSVARHKAGSRPHRLRARRYLW